MQIIRDSDALLDATSAWSVEGHRRAFVPTMGALHDGHLALIAEGRRRAERVAVSIFVNPLQFNDAADLARYPRQEETDLAKLKAAGCDLVWLPTPEQLYPLGFATRISVAGISERWEGEYRPGHFDGVATVVAKLLIEMGASVAIFGEKDWQQLSLIRRMVTDLGLHTDIVGHATVREKDGLAMSSRNALLSPEERARAVALPQAMAQAAARITRGEKVAAALEEARGALRGAGFSGVDYLALVDADSLEPLQAAAENMRLLAAATIGKVRLIDNIPVTLEQQVRG